MEVKGKTYNRRDSQMVTHSSTSRPVQCLCMAERTGCPVFTDLWSYVFMGDKTGSMFNVYCESTIMLSCDNTEPSCTRFFHTEYARTLEILKRAVFTHCSSE